MLPAALIELIDHRVAQLKTLAGCAWPRQPDFESHLRRLLLASDYAFERLQHRPELLLTLNDAAASPFSPSGDTGFADRLRRFRHASAVRIAWRDVAGMDSLEQTLAATSQLAEACIAAALVQAEEEMAARHGRVYNAQGHVQRLVVFALGKLGGGELNFSSDIDLVFAYPEAGSSDGERPLEADIYFTRLGQRLIQLLGDVSAEGFVYRVDMRLRPFGQSGRLALGFAAMEQYFQRDGRDWERYAWIKARPVAGAIEAGLGFLQTLRPFVFRRYFDYTAFEGLREMKALIAAEVERRDLADHLKLGPGGIREIEFIVQVQQLIRGGREPELRTRSLLPALAILAERGYISTAAGTALATAYRFLRKLENCLQMWREEQTHQLPTDPLQQLRVALGMGFDSWDALLETLAQHRQSVTAEFQRVFEAARMRSPVTDAFIDYWSHLDRPDAATRLASAGLAEAEAIHTQLTQFAGNSAVISLPEQGRKRLNRVMPALLALAAHNPQPAVIVARMLKLLHAILRRSSYLALLAEQPAALHRLVEIMSASAWLAERIGTHPLLLDDLLDRREQETPVDQQRLNETIDRVLKEVDTTDTEALLGTFNEVRQSEAFRIALAHIFHRQPAPASARQLAWVAEAIVNRVWPLACAETAHTHGHLPGIADIGEGVAIIAYGSLGGSELGFESDLDLVFLYDEALAGTESDGGRKLEASRYLARLAQRLVSLLGTLTAAGRLYEVDLRLRPDGAKGLLLSTLESYAEYQQERAWTWEHQALVRARFVAGDPHLRQRFEAIRRAALCQHRDPLVLRNEVIAMRERLRGERDRSSANNVDLKQGRGGLVDLEFLLQALVLRHAARHPALVAATATPELLQSLQTSGILPCDETKALAEAHAGLLERALACTLDARPRVVAIDSQIETFAAAIREAYDRYLGLASV